MKWEHSAWRERARGFYAMSAYKLTEMDFSRQNLEQKRPFFLQYAPCGVKNETKHIWWGGKGFPDAVGALEGVVMVMIKFHVEILRAHDGSSIRESPLPNRTTIMSA